MDAHIDLRQLRYFLAVAETLHVGRAAQRLHISQPPLTRQIRQLESQLGVALFVRARSGMILTAAGTALVPEARRTLAQAAKAVQAARAAGAGEGEGAGRDFTLGYTTVFDPAAYPDVAPAFARRFPDWRLVTRRQPSVALVREVRLGRMDAAFIGRHTDTRGLATVSVREDPFMVALPAAHRLARKRRIALADLAGEPLFWFERRRNPGFHDYCEAYFNRVGFDPVRLPEPPDHHVLLGLVAEGQGLALVASSMRSVTRKGIAYRPLAGAEGLSMGIVLAYDEARRSPMLDAFIALVQALA